MYTLQTKEMQNKHAEYLEFLTKGGAWIAYILIGLVGKFGWDIVNNKKLSFWYIFGTGCIAFCIGFLVSRWCIAHPSLDQSIIVPASALVSRDIMLFITMIDWAGVLKLVTGKSTKR